MSNLAGFRTASGRHVTIASLLHRSVIKRSPRAARQATVVKGGTRPRPAAGPRQLSTNPTRPPPLSTCMNSSTSSTTWAWRCGRQSCFRWP